MENTKAIIDDLVSLGKDLLRYVFKECLYSRVNGIVGSIFGVLLLFFSYSAWKDWHNPSQPWFWEGERNFVVLALLCIGFLFVQFVAWRVLLKENRELVAKVKELEPVIENLARDLAESNSRTNHAKTRTELLESHMSKADQLAAGSQLVSEHFRDLYLSLREEIGRVEIQNKAISIETLKCLSGKIAADQANSHIETSFDAGEFLVLQIENSGNRVLRNVVAQVIEEEGGYTPCYWIKRGPAHRHSGVYVIRGCAKQNISVGFTEDLVIARWIKNVGWFPLSKESSVAPLSFLLPPARVISRIEDLEISKFNFSVDGRIVPVSPKVNTKFIVKFKCENLDQSISVELSMDEDGNPLFI